MTSVAERGAGSQGTLACDLPVAVGSRQHLSWEPVKLVAALAGTWWARSTVPMHLCDRDDGALESQDGAGWHGGQGPVGPGQPHRNCRALGGDS